MFWNRFLIPSLAVLAAVAFLNWLAGVYFFYDSVAWYDFMMHFLGGLWVGLFALWVLNLPRMERFAFFAKPTNIVLAVFIVGIFWEFFELYFGITSIRSTIYAWDTTHDLVMDVLGACAAVYISKKWKK